MPSAIRAAIRSIQSSRLLRGVGARDRVPRSELKIDTAWARSLRYPLGGIEAVIISGPPNLQVSSKAGLAAETGKNSAQKSPSLMEEIEHQGSHKALPPCLSCQIIGSFLAPSPWLPNAFFRRGLPRRRLSPVAGFGSIRLVKPSGAASRRRSSRAIARKTRMSVSRFTGLVQACPR